MPISIRLLNTRLAMASILLNEFFCGESKCSNSGCTKQLVRRKKEGKNKTGDCCYLCPFLSFFLSFFLQLMHNMLRTQSRDELMTGWLLTETKQITKKKKSWTIFCVRYFLHRLSHCRHNIVACVQPAACVQFRNKGLNKVKSRERPLNWSNKYARMHARTLVKESSCISIVKSSRYN